ncbi:unnamed protein product [Phytophthora fragariaefolia]|uniref:Unnamed protein product n=1 Tax=Phytophthora fragariaefolia TaxID=1490495 RepID=A0A9W6Y706_9STRA|nr:unnamed protein product [Phytophthora fragariaefolia]
MLNRRTGCTGQGSTSAARNVTGPWYLGGDPSFAWYVGGSKLAKIPIRKERVTSTGTGRTIITIIPRRSASSRCIGTAMATPTCAVAFGRNPTLAEGPARCGIGRRAAAVRCIHVDGRGLGELCAASLGSGLAEIAAVIVVQTGAEHHRRTTAT